MLVTDPEALQGGDGGWFRARLGDRAMLSRARIGRGLSVRCGRLQGCWPDSGAGVAWGSAARGKRSRPGYWPEWGRSLKIRMPRYLFIHACLCG